MTWEVVCEHAAYPVTVFVAVGNLSVPSVPVMPAPPWWTSAPFAPPWEGGVSSALVGFSFICSALAGFLICQLCLPPLDLRCMDLALCSPQFRLCSTSLWDYVFVGASGSRSFEGGGTVIVTSWATSALCFPASLLPLTCTPLSITHTWDLSVDPRHLSPPIKLPISLHCPRCCIVWSRSCYVTYPQVLQRSTPRSLALQRSSAPAIPPRRKEGHMNPPS